MFHRFEYCGKCLVCSVLLGAGSWVDCVFLNSCFMWPFLVASDGAKCLHTRSSVWPGHVGKKSALIAEISEVRGN